MSPFPRFLSIVALSALATGVTRAQDVAQQPAYVAFVEGAATLERDGQISPAVVNMPLVAGDRLRTERGRIEIRFPDGTGIEIGEYSAVEFLTATRVRLLAGTLDRLEPLQANVGAVSGSYLPQNLQMYGVTFDRYGSWRYTSHHGYVWYPMVAPDWRPYHYGYWEPIRPYGWTWIGADVWSWPTHHYGRWGFERNTWFWIPDHTFAAAWVSWGSAPGYVSWCPLGFDNRPVFALHAYHDAWSGWTVLPRRHFGYHGNYAHDYAIDPRHLPRDAAFVTQSVAPVAVPRHVTNGAPAGLGVAVPRETAVSRQSPVTSRQSPVATPESPVFSRQSPVVSPRSTVISPQSPVIAQPSPVISPRSPAGIPDRRGFDEPRVRTNDYRIAVPRMAPPPPPTPEALPMPMPAPTFGVPRASAPAPMPEPAIAVPRVNPSLAPVPAPAFAVPRASQPPPQALPAPVAAPPAAPPPAAPQRNAPAEGGNGHAHERRRG